MPRVALPGSWCHGTALSVRPVTDGWRHLVPVVDALVADGKAFVGATFSPTQGGFDCRMARPLDFELLRTVVSGTDKNIHLAPSSDLLWCSAATAGPPCSARSAFRKP